MPYDRDLADRIRTVLGAWDDTHEAAGSTPDDLGLGDLGMVDEKPMFGGLGFMVAGHLAVCAGAHADLLVRVDPAELATLCEADGVEPMAMAGRPSRSWVRVEPEVLVGDDLATWVGRGVAAARQAPRR